MLNSNTQRYRSDFYKNQRDGSLRSAQAVLPIVFDLYKPNSIVDFGCGVGTWLSVAKQSGVKHCLGLEGPWVKSQPLAVEALEIQEVDLEHPVSLANRFELAMSLEVAEHLTPDRAETFVADLCEASNVVLFSAATPGNDGVGHQNEQWVSFWANHFVRRGYVPLDLVRPAIRHNNQIEYWYRTNIVLYAKVEQAQAILKRAKLKHLESLDLPRRIEIVGVREAKTHLVSSAKHFVHWTTKRFVDESRHVLSKVI